MHVKYVPTNFVKHTTVQSLVLSSSAMLGFLKIMEN